MRCARAAVSRRGSARMRSPQVREALMGGSGRMEAGEGLLCPRRVRKGSSKPRRCAN